MSECPMARWSDLSDCNWRGPIVRFAVRFTARLSALSDCPIVRWPLSVRDYLLRLGYLSAIDITCHQHDCGIRETETRAMTMHDHELLMYDRGHSLHDLHPSFRD